MNVFEIRTDRLLGTNGKFCAPGRRRPNHGNFVEQVKLWDE